MYQCHRFHERTNPFSNKSPMQFSSFLRLPTGLVIVERIVRPVKFKPCIPQPKQLQALWRGMKECCSKETDYNIFRIHFTSQWNLRLTLKNYWSLSFQNLEFLKFVHKGNRISGTGERILVHGEDWRRILGILRGNKRVEIFVNVSL